jgi:hypothetical protein
LKETGNVRLSLRLKLLERPDIESQKLSILDKVGPFKARRELTDRRLRRDTGRRSSDDDMRHSRLRKTEKSGRMGTRWSRRSYGGEEAEQALLRETHFLHRRAVGPLLRTQPALSCAEAGSLSGGAWETSDIVGRYRLDLANSVHVVRSETRKFGVEHVQKRLFSSMPGRMHHPAHRAA